MSARHKYRTLVLNADYRPISTWPLSVMPAEKVLSKLLNDKYDVVETWPAIFRTPSVTVDVPKVVALRRFVNVYSQPKFCRRSLLLRDGYRCQYCMKQFDSADLTFDHVRPRADRGETTWENIVMACVPCNKAKRDQREMKPARAPKKPTTAELLRAGLRFLEPTLRADFSDWLYWDTELRP